MTPRAVAVRSTDVIGRENSSQHGREAGTSVAVLPARKSSEKTALPTHRNKQLLMFSGPHSSQWNTFFLFVIHRGAKPQFWLMGLRTNTIKYPNTITAK